MFKIMRSLRSSKCLTTTVELMFTTQKASVCSHWTNCSVFNWKYLFWVNLTQKLKIYSLSWHFVSRLIQICRIPCWCSLFLSLTGNIFFSKFGPKNQIVSLSWNFITDYFEYAELCRKYVVFTFPVLDHKNPFWTNLIKKIKTVSLNWNSVPKLIWTCWIQWWFFWFWP